MAVSGDAGGAPARASLWNDPRVRAVVFQVLVLGGVILFGVYIVNNTLVNMESRGISSGFDFMTRTAGFDIGMTLVDYDEASSYGRAFVVSLLNTLLVSAIGIAFATFLGFLVGIARLSGNWLVSRLAEVYIEIIRNVPLLLQIFFWYFAVLRALPPPRHSFELADTFFLNLRGLFVPRPVFEAGFPAIPVGFLVGLAAVVFVARWARRRREATGEQFHTVYVSAAILAGLPLLAGAATGFPLSWDHPVLQGFNFQGGMTLIPELVALVIALSVYTASFIAEIVRSGIQAVSRGQTEAAHSLGLRRGPALRLVIVPQALRVIIPPLTNQYLNLTKNSSLAAAIAYPDLVLVFAGTALMQTGQAVEIIAITMAVYLTISLFISAVMNLYNRKMALVER